MNRQSTIRTFGKIQYQLDWDWNGWYYVSRKNEKIYMFFFIGTIEHETHRLKQIVIGPLAITWS